MSPLLAQVASEPASLPWPQILMGLLGGLALFLMGLDRLSTSLRALAGEGMKIMLKRMTTNRITGMVTGFCVTALLQSSTITTVLLVGFASAGVVSSVQSVGVIMGAKIGSTVTAQIIAFQATDLALAMVAVGYPLMLLGRGEWMRHGGGLVLGFGLLFLGMAVMSTGMEPLREHEPALRLMAGLEWPVYAIIAGAVFTALIQSSAVTVGLAVTMAAEGLLTLPAGIGIALGANIGTCVTALLASIGRPREAVRVAVIHVFAAIMGVLLWLGFIGVLADLARWVSPSAVHLEGLDRLRAEAPRQIANAHTLFNVINALIMLPFAGLIARIAYWIVPEGRGGVEDEASPHHLDRRMLNTPALALDCVRREIGRLGGLVRAMVGQAMRIVSTGTGAQVQQVRAQDEKVDKLHAAIERYLNDAATRPHGDREGGAFQGLTTAANYLEQIGDVVETGITTLGHRRLANNLTFPESARRDVARFHELVDRTLALAVEAVVNEDQGKAREVASLKPRIRRQAEEALEKLQAHYRSDDAHAMEALTFQTDLIENLRTIATHARHMARTVYDERAERNA